MEQRVDLLLDAGAIVAESPSWDAKNKLLYWVDIDGKKVHIYDPSKNEDKIINSNQYVGCIAPNKSGGAILAMHHGIYFLNFETEEFTFVCDPESDKPDNRFNDGKCDAYGRFWAGTMNLEEKDPLGALYRIDRDHSVTKMVDKVTVSNGIAWNPDNSIMYYIDTRTKSVFAFDYDLKAGSISNRRVAVKIPDGQGSPDGMTSDSEGMIWVAHWGGWRISRWDPRNGKLIEVINIPVEKVTSCVFGGDDLDELYITTASRGLNTDGLKKQPHAGGIFKYKTHVRGMPTYAYDEKK
ncbi:MAG: SMP-30/gluconolactonase/LRE family protein [Athalassotoga sp.]|uniref:SMP-30/gluconolactonase/LRE family protein n=1 Tax=Athalassotoga sp. TaxID=2022597 RepID=UPI003D069FF2